MEIKSILESLLFVADHPVTLEDLATTLQIDAEDVELALQALAAEYKAQVRGIRIQRKGDSVQMVSAPEAAPEIERYLGLETSGHLSPAALETLSIVAYRQHITRAQIEAIRGVDSTSVLRSLVRRGLLQQMGRAQTVGRPILFGTTFEFLQQFGLESERDLPEWDRLEALLAEREGHRDQRPPR